MTRGQKSAAVRMHNAGRTLSYIASKVGESEIAVLSFLQDRIGFPGKIAINDGSTKETMVKSRLIRRHASSAASDVDGIEKVYWGRGVTLPRVKGLEAAE